MEYLKGFMKLHPLWRFALISGAFVAFLVIAAHRDAVDSIAHLIQSFPFIVYIPIRPSTAHSEDQQEPPPEQETKPTA